jgi:two-component system, chemotaxis family, CheB/CheR fusion protein
VSYSGVRVPTDNGELRCMVEAKPIMHPRTGARNVLITFREMTTDDHVENPVDRSEVSTAIPLSEASQERMTTLEAELQYTRETLQATIEELETSNEEMQATNEELVASNEELQSTNEELHSVNEELYTVNAEYQQKISELKELNADMSHLLEGTDVGTVFLDRELRIRRFTSRIANVFRFQQHDIGRRIGDFSHNIERSQLMDEIEHALAQGNIIEDEVRDRAGTPYFLRILPYRVNQRTNGTLQSPELAPIDGVVLTLTDMTALDKARTRVEQLSAIVEWSDDAIMGTSLDGTITSWNRGAEKLYGYAPDEAVGKSARMLMRPGSEHELDGYLRQIAKGGKVEHVVTLCRRKDGSLIDASVMISPVFNHTKIVGAASIARDISKLAETQRALEEQQRRVQALLVTSEENSHRREEFLAMLSHELRNPLAAVLSATTALREGAAPELAQRCQSVIERQATHMKRLLDDMLDVSRITSSKFAVKAEQIDLRDPIETAVEATQPAFKEPGVTLRCDLPARPLPVNGDMRRLTQVVANLLSNAASYSAPGGIVDLQVMTKGNSVVIRVRDEGEGIDPALQPKIFDLFVQSEQKLDRPRGGLGVGLSLAKTIVQLHHGTIEVHSDGPETGSEFTVRLPLVSPVVSTLVQDAPGGPCRIVLVDDQDDSRDMLRTLLEKRNHVVFDAADGGRAVQLIAQQKPDVAFIDIGLPVLDGFEVAQQIRKRPELKDVMLVALSGYGNHSDVDAALAAGFDEHVTKPAELKKLEQILARKKPGSGCD